MQYEDGWVLVPSTMRPLEAYWRSETTGPLDYKNGGIAHYQWINATHDRAALAIADGNQTTGGRFHLWVSPGAGTAPFEIPLMPHAVYAYPEGSGDEFVSAGGMALALALEVLGLRPLAE